MVLCQPCSQFAGKSDAFQRNGLSRHLQSAQHQDAVKQSTDQQAREQEHIATHSVRDKGPAVMNSAPLDLGQRDTLNSGAPGSSFTQDPFTSITTVNGVMYDRDGQPIVIPAGHKQSDRERLEQELDALMATELFNNSGATWLDRNIMSHTVEEGPTRTNADTQHDLGGKAVIHLLVSSCNPYLLVSHIILAIQHVQTLMMTARVKTGHQESMRNQRKIPGIRTGPKP